MAKKKPKAASKKKSQKNRAKADSPAVTVQPCALKDFYKLPNYYYAVPEATKLYFMVLAAADTNLLGLLLASESIPVRLKTGRMEAPSSIVGPGGKLNINSIVTPVDFKCTPDQVIRSDFDAIREPIRGAVREKKSDFFKFAFDHVEAQSKVFPGKAVVNKNTQSWSDVLDALEQLDLQCDSHGEPIVPQFRAAGDVLKRLYENPMTPEEQSRKNAIIEKARKKCRGMQ